MAAPQQPLFRPPDLTEVDSLETSEIESMCMSCGETGTTRLLLTKIPLFQDVILMSFSCPHCNESNNEIQPGSPIQDFGVRYKLTVANSEYLNQMVVKADSAIVRIPELDFEIPANTQKGRITTIESILTAAVSDLEKEQPLRKSLHPELASKLESFITKLKDCLQLKSSFTFVLDDPTGNSFVENKLAPTLDPNLLHEQYTRNEEQDRQLGITEAPATEGECSNGQEQPTLPVGEDEVMQFAANCPSCHSPTITKMKMIDIPHFKQVIIMATACDYCGHRSNEAKSGTGISDHGTKITLKLTHKSDLSRDILKAETATVALPELEFEVSSGTLGGRFTTVEGLLQQAKEQLVTSNPFATGDSANQLKLTLFIEKLSEIIEGRKLGVSLVLDDPAGNSYIQNVYAPDPDPEMLVEEYQRTFEQNEELGLNNMKTDNYE